MDAILKARELGKTIQAEDCFIAYREAKIKNDADFELQEMIGEFNLTRQNLNMEMSKNESEKDNNKIDELNQHLQSSYAKIMSNPNMAEYTITKGAVDKLLNQVNQIISMCCDGADPDTCEPAESCGGSCSSCSGCG